MSHSTWILTWEILQLVMSSASESCDLPSRQSGVSIISPSLSPSHCHPLSATHLLFRQAKERIPLWAVILSSDMLPGKASETNLGNPTGDKPTKTLPVLCSLYSNQVALCAIGSEGFSIKTSVQSMTRSISSNSFLKHSGWRCRKPSSSPGIWSKELRQ